MALLVGSVLLGLTVHCGAVVCSSLQSLAERLQLQGAGRHLLARVDKIMSYDATSLSLQPDGRIQATGLPGGKKLELYVERQTLYKRTTTGNGSGVNPVSLEGFAVVNWQLRQLAPRQLLLEFDLEGSSCSQHFTQLLFCQNVRYADEA